VILNLEAVLAVSAVVDLHPDWKKMRSEAVARDHAFLALFDLPESYAEVQEGRKREERVSPN
jgi:hypothetical protein